MKSFTFLFVLLLSIAMTITLFPSLSSQESVLDDTIDAYLRGKGSFRRNSTYTCDKYPRVCDTKGSPGPDCCRKNCVNVMTDGLNCGRCGKKCRYSEVCCDGWCVDTNFHKRHCGKCNNICEKGSECSYGMCDYA